MQVYPPTGVIFTGIAVLLTVSTFFDCVASADAIKAVSDCQDALTNTFERIENFFRRLETYIEVPPTTGMTDIIVKIMVEDCFRQLTAI
jgi:hypothetical protein